jgi:RNA polymerase sigma-70 factor (ECF subfamily)
LLAAIKHFLADEREKAIAQKRGGGQPVIPLDAQPAEGRYQLEPAHEASPDKLFERRWALSLLAAVFARLEREYAAAEKRELFQVVQPFLSPDSDETDYTTAARQLHLNEGAVRMAVPRLRRRYAELFREEVANTIADPGEIEDEMRYLRRILSA